MKNLKMFSLGIAMLLFYVSVSAQKPANAALRTITGVVSDLTGPIPGASVVVLGTTRGTQTDIDGKYGIIASEGETLVFSYVGMNDKNVIVQKSNTINVTLDEGITLSEVVVTTMGVKRKAAAVTYSHQVVKAESLTQSGNANAVKKLVGKVSGLKISEKARDKNVKYQRGTIADQDNKDYESFIENQFESPASAPLSTFSIDVDNASYTNIRRFINNGQTVPKDAVRVEEMVNFFKYQYPQPTSEHPFSINTEYSDCPWNPKHQLLRIGLQGKNIKSDKLPASNLVFLIDVSGSMGHQNKLPLLIESFKILLKELRKEDKVAIVVYAGAAGMVLPPTSGDQKEIIIAALSQLNAGGSTAGGAGIELAYKLAVENFIKGGNNRVILATDGDFNVGSSSDKDMKSLIEEKRKSGVFLTCLGYGMGNYKDSKLETLANKGNGNYAYIDNIQEANRFLSKEFKGSMFAIAKDVKIQIEFNPNYVQQYRLIGYENRKLRPEDFNNDVIDAGELGSGHTVTALYEVIPSGVTSEFAANIDPLKYSTPTVASKGIANNQLAFIKFRYKKTDGNKSILMEQPIATAAKAMSESSADFKFCAAVAWFGLQLRDSQLIADKSRSNVKALASQGLANDVDGYKSEFIRLVDSGASN